MFLWGLHKVLDSETKRRIEEEQRRQKERSREKEAKRQAEIDDGIWNGKRGEPLPSHLRQ